MSSTSSKTTAGEFVSAEGKFTGNTSDDSLKFDDFKLKFLAHVNAGGVGLQKILLGKTIVPKPDFDRPTSAALVRIAKIEDARERRIAGAETKSQISSWDEYEEYLLNRARVFNMLQAVIATDSEAFALVRSECSISDVDDQCDPNRLWEALNAKYAGKTMERRMQLQSEWSSIAIESGESLTTFGQRLQRLRNNLAAVGADVGDEKARTVFYVACRAFSKPLADALIAKDTDIGADFTLAMALKFAETFEKKSEVVEHAASASDLKNGTSDKQDIKALKANHLPVGKFHKKNRNQFRKQQRKEQRSQHSQKGSGGNYTEKQKTQFVPKNKGILKNVSIAQDDDYSDDEDSPASSNPKFKFTVRTSRGGNKGKGQGGKGRFSARVATLTSDALDDSPDSQATAKAFRAYVAKEGSTNSFVICDTGTDAHVISEPFARANAGLSRPAEKPDPSARVTFGGGQPHKVTRALNLGLMKGAMVVEKAHPTTNLLAVSKLDDEGWMTMVANNKMYFYPPGTEVAATEMPTFTATRRGGTYTAQVQDLVRAASLLDSDDDDGSMDGSDTEDETSLTGSPICESPISSNRNPRRQNVAANACKSTPLNKADLYRSGARWHRALMHVNTDRLLRMAKHGSADGLPSSAVQLFRRYKHEELKCLHCPLGMCPQYPVGGFATERKQYGVGEKWKLDYVPMGTKSLGGNTGFFLAKESATSFIIEDYAADKNVKTTVLGYIQRFIDEVATDGYTIKCLHFDADTIFEDQYVQDFLTERHIAFYYSEPGEHRHSGDVERSVQSVKGTSRKALAAAKMPEPFWSYAVGQAVYVLNRLITARFDKDPDRKYKTPYELYKGTRPRLDHIAMFGAACVSRKPNPEQLTVLEERARLGILLGNAEKYNDAYVVYSLKTGRIVISKDVRIDENRLGINGEPADWFNGQPGPSTPPRPVADTGGMEDIVSIEDADELEQVADDLAPAPGQKRKRRGRPPKASTPADEPPEQTAMPGAAKGTRPHASQKRGRPDARLESPSSDSGKRRPGRPRRMIIPRTDGIPDGPPPRKSPRRVNAYVAEEAVATDTSEFGDWRIPQSYEEAMSPPFRERYEPAIVEELTSIYGYNTFGKAVELPPGAKPLGLKWIFDVKRDEKTGKVTRYKARLVAKGFTQVKGDTYNLTYSPTPNRESLRLLFAMAAMYNMHTFRGDVKTAFLNGDIEEEIYCKGIQGLPDLPAGFAFPLRKALYGTKQASRQWNKKLDSTMRQLGFTPCEADRCMYIKRNGEDFTLVLVYVDDVFGAATNLRDVEWFNSQFSKAFIYKDLGPLTGALGMKVDRLASGDLKVSNSVFIEDLLREFGMLDCRSVKTPAVPGTKLTKAMEPTAQDIDYEMQSNYRKIVGSLMYLMCTVRLDIAPAVGDLGRFMHNPGIEHYKAAIHVLRYLRGTSTLGMIYKCLPLPPGAKPRPIIEAYADANWAEADDRISTSGNIIRLIDARFSSQHVEGNFISYVSKRQECVTLSSTEAEYVSAGRCTQTVAWLRRLLDQLGFIQRKPTVLYEDNTGCIVLAGDEVISQRSKHIDIKYHYIRQEVRNGNICMEYLQTTDMNADGLTKNLSFPRFSFLRARNGLV